MKAAQQSLPGFHVPPLVECDVEGSIQQRFLAFHSANPQVFTMLVSFARQLRAKGRKRIGISLLYEVLRWNFYLSTTDPNSEYKLSNSYRSRYARKIMSECEDLDGFITCRGLKSP